MRARRGDALSDPFGAPALLASDGSRARLGFYCFSGEALHDMAVSQDTENLGQTGCSPLLADWGLTQAK
jgi:hypothetical protein